VVAAFVHVGGRPTHISFGLISLESVQEARCSDIFYLKKYVVAMGLLTSTMGLLLLCYIATIGQPLPLLLCNYYSDGPFAHG
jgi:hypothetical protein